MAVFTEELAGRSNASTACTRRIGTTTGPASKRISSSRFGSEAALCGQRQSRRLDLRASRWKKCGPGSSRHFPSCICSPPDALMDIYKDVGHPADVAARYRLRQARAASHLVGHTRMATESAVTPDRAHPFTAGEDFCLVHNGIVVQPLSDPAQARAARHRLRHRQRYRGGLPLFRVAHARGRRSRRRHRTRASRSWMGSTRF